MTDDDIRLVAASGFADALRRSPIVFGLALILAIEALAIVFLGWTALERAAIERERVADLTKQLVECHRNKL